MASPIYRTTALDRLRSPDQLDESISITSSTGWLAALGALVVVGAALAWGVLGTVPTRLTGAGLIVYRDSDIYQADAEAAGLVETILVKPTDRVTKGQTIALIRKPDLETQLTSARHEMADLIEDKDRTEAERDVAQSDLKEYLKKRTDELHERIKQDREQVEELTKAVEGERKLLDRGLTTRRTVASTQASLFDAMQDISSAISELTSLQLTEQENRDKWTTLVHAADDAILRKQHDIDQLEAQLALGSKVTAPLTGVVSFVNAVSGSYVSPGEAIAVISSTSDALSARVFISEGDAKLIEAGMPVQIEPGTVRKEENGTIAGIVRSISEFPLSAQAVMAVLQNEDLVKTYTAGGAPFMVEVEMLPGDGPGGLKWSSNNPPAFAITAGTLAKASITVRSQRPLAMIIPAFRALLGMP